MDSNYREYNYVSSFARIDSILAEPASNFQEVKALPDRDTLTYENGYYGYCTAVFVDIRESSKLPSIYNRPALAKLYRAFISEMVALFNSVTFAREINIVGDCVWGVFNTTTKERIQELLTLTGKVMVLTKVLNYKLKNAGYATPLKVGVGMSYGRALMIKAGSNGSGINDVVYMGDVVNSAAKLAAKGSKGNSRPIMADSLIYTNLNETSKTLFTLSDDKQCYQGDFINIEMHNWYNANCK